VTELYFATRDEKISLETGNLMKRDPFSSGNKLCTGIIPVRLFTEIQIKTRSTSTISQIAHDLHTRNLNLQPDYPQS